MAVAPIAVPGKNPGEVMIPALGKSFQQIELREDDVHDAILILSGSIGAGAEYILFRDLTAKNEQHTSLTMTRRINAGDEAAIFRIGVHPRGAVGNATAVFPDLKKILENGILRIQFNRRLITEGPMIKYQSGYGIGGYSDETGTSSVTVGVASAAAAPTLFVPQQLQDNDDLNCKIRFPDAQWVTNTASASAYTTPSLSAQCVVSCFLHGVLKAPLGK